MSTEEGINQESQQSSNVPHNSRQQQSRHYRPNNSHNNYNESSYQTNGDNNTPNTSTTDDVRQVCSFYSRVGACRHGNNCVRIHQKPKTSKTVLFMKLYDNPKYIKGFRSIKDQTNENAPDNEDRNDLDTEINENNNATYPNPDETTVHTVHGDLRVLKSLSESDIQRKINHLYKDLFVELGLSYGPIDWLVICENVNNHLSGNVYVKFKNEDSAMRCVKNCNDRWYDNKPIFAELSPVSNFEDANCRSYQTGCDRKGLCNFMHVRKPDGYIIRELKQAQDAHISKQLAIAANE